MILNIIYLNSLKTLDNVHVHSGLLLPNQVIYPTAHSTPSLNCLTVSSNFTQGPALPSAFSILVNGNPSFELLKHKTWLMISLPAPHTPMKSIRRFCWLYFSKYIQNLTISYYVYQYYRSRPPWLLASHQCNCLLIAFCPYKAGRVFFSHHELYHDWQTYSVPGTIHRDLYPSLILKVYSPKVFSVHFQVKVVKWNSLSRITQLFFERAGPKHLKSQAFLQSSCWWIIWFSPPGNLSKLPDKSMQSKKSSS